MSKIIVSQPWGGLGDNLQFSTIPRLCYENGISFGLGRRNQHRNQEIHDLVWKPNPYVTLSNEDHVGADHMAPPPQSDSKNIIGWNETKYGFEGKNFYPDIHYDCKIKTGFLDRAVVSVGIISSWNQYTVEFIKKTILGLLKEDPILIKTKYDNDFNLGYLEDLKLDEYFIKDVFEYCDIIRSCRSHYSLMSGNHVLAAGIKYKYQTDTKLYCLYPNKNFEHFDVKKKKSEWLFPNVNYILEAEGIKRYSPK